MATKQISENRKCLIAFKSGQQNLELYTRLLRIEGKGIS